MSSSDNILTASVAGASAGHDPLQPPAARHGGCGLLKIYTNRAYKGKDGQIATNVTFPQIDTTHKPRKPGKQGGHVVNVTWNLPLLLVAHRKQTTQLISYKDLG